jgi:hypothetical protein
MCRPMKLTYYVVLLGLSTSESTPRGYILILAWSLLPNSILHGSRSVLTFVDDCHLAASQVYCTVLSAESEWGIPKAFAISPRSLLLAAIVLLFSG